MDPPPPLYTYILDTYTCESTDGRPPAGLEQSCFNLLIVQVLDNIQIPGTHSQNYILKVMERLYRPAISLPPLLDLLYVYKHLSTCMCIHHGSTLHL